MSVLPTTLTSVLLAVVIVALASPVWYVYLKGVKRYKAEGWDDPYDDTENVKVMIPHPVIGYKRAWLLSDQTQMPGTSTQRVFEGVSGTGKTYGTVDTATHSYHGFYMYKTLNEALHHPQEGNVFLEVVGYGDVEEHSKGYTTTNQRVTQVMVSQCALACGEAAVAYFENPRHRSYSIWLCSMHAREENKRIRRLRRQKVRKAPAFGVTAQELENRLTRLTGQTVAVRSVYAMDPFVAYPTKSWPLSIQPPADFIPLADLIPEDALTKTA